VLSEWAIEYFLRTNVIAAVKPIPSRRYTFDDDELDEEEEEEEDEEEEDEELPPVDSEVLRRRKLIEDCKVYSNV